MVIFFIYFFSIARLYSLTGIDFVKNIKVLKGDKFIQIVRLNNPLQDIDTSLLKVEINKEVKSNSNVLSISRTTDNNNFSFIEIKVEYLFEGLGFIKIPPLKVIYKGDSYVSSEAEVSVLRADEINSFGLPVDLYWDLNKREVYEYQSIGLVLRSNWLLDSNSNKISGFLPAIKDAMIEKMPIFGDIQYRTFNNKEILDVPFYNFVLTPLKGSKNVLIPSFSFNIDSGLVREAPELLLKVKPIPKEVKSLAVGTFRIDYETPTYSTIEQDIFTILIKITGQGNFPHFYFPEIETYNSKILNKKKNYSFKPSKDGYKGSISQIYTVKPDTKGSVFLNIGDFSYLNPDNGTVYILKGKKLKYEYSGNFDSINKIHNNVDSDFKLLSYSDILNYKNKTFLFFVPYYYLLLIPGFLLSLAILINYKKFFAASSFGLAILILAVGISLNAVNDSLLSEKNINDLIENYNAKNYDAALIKIDNILKKYPNYSGLWLNRALVLSKMDRDFDAIYSAYKAFLSSPNNEAPYKVIGLIEAKNGVTDNIRNNSFIFSNIFFIISLFLINFLVVSISYKFLAKNLKKIIIFLLFSAVCFTIFETYYFYSEQQSEVGIIKGDLVSLYKVPDNFSRSWRFLKGNVSVYILDSKDDFVLIETSYGLQGWIHKNFVVSLKDNLI
ncbi:SH3 domain-containing protein [Borreliella garinii]|uniref:SH3 domain-containing protein n=1 Tax=Borreliella garinii TaxID=29519 RepID=UPI00293159C2|nr:SH3 domain-containing protein [Borreliella garinii]WNZ73006.1 SH3 domain-containing protein [Borreliella garinii]